MAFTFKDEKITNWPNYITSVRLVLTPFFIISVVNQKKCALAILIIIFISDWLDGFIARKFKQKTYFGKLYDGLTDSLFLLSSLITISIIGKLNPVYAVLLILPRIMTFYMLMYKSKTQKALDYKTDIYKKIIGVAIYSLILISLLKKEINFIALMATIVIYTMLTIKVVLLIWKRKRK